MPEVFVTARASPAEVLELSADSSDSREIAAGAARVYEIKLRASEYLHLLVNKGDLNLKVTLLTGEGLKLKEFVSRRYGTLRVSFIAPATRSYRLELLSLETDTSVRRYDLRVEEIRKASARDRKDELASRSYAEAERLRTEWSAPSLRAAIEKYRTAGRGWQSISEEAWAAEALEAEGDALFILGEHELSLRSYKDALKASRGADRYAAVRALNRIAYLYINLGDDTNSLAYSRKARALQDQQAGTQLSADELREDAQTLNNFGEVHYSLGELKEALDSFEHALDRWTQSGDRRGQALAHLNLGYTCSDSGNLQKASDHFQQALALWRTVEDRRGEALSQTALGAISSFIGERQLALNAYEQALRIFRAYGDQRSEKVALNSIGQVYEDLNELPTSLDYYKLALDLSRANGDRAGEAVAKYYVARVYRLMGQNEHALSYYNQSLRLSRRLGKKRVVAYALNDIGIIYNSLGRRKFALDQYKEVLKFYREAGDRRGQANTLKTIGDIYYSSGERERARSCYEEALSYSRAAWDRSGEADALYRIARAERDGGELDKALNYITDSIGIIEEMRSQVASHQLRTSYFASIHKHYEFLLALLMQLHALRPTGGYASAAMQASENARARSLVETLLEVKADVRLGVDPTVLERERTLQRELNAKALYLMRLRNSAQTEADAEQIEKEIRQLTNEYEQVQSLIRSQSPRYESLMQPHPPSLEEIQNELRGDDTILLEYSMGEEKSYVWAVTSDSFSAYELPAREEIEQLTREVRSLLTARPGDNTSIADNEQSRAAELDQQYWRKAAELSRTLFGPVAQRLGNKRLLIVAEGALQYLPFEALPAPETAEESVGKPTTTSDPVPLAIRHEVVYLPSASTLIALRRQAALSIAAPKSVFVLADPVFDKGDPRVKMFDARANEADGSAARLATLKNAGGINFPRLPSTRQEAETIVSLIPENARAVATDFAANRALALSAELARYQIVHIATHSVVNSQHPELSGIILSMVNERGQEEDGFLQLHDIYSLKLGAELVVLSACNTALGKEVRGEGLIGLTRGFMYAGTSSVVASLWKVDDAASAELMTHFYKAMFEDNLPPAAALKSAKEAMWRQKHWRSPYYWSAFVLQGEYRSRNKDSNTPILVIVAVMLAALGIALTRPIWRRLRA
jgi:CHAT domain-containing protein/predicted negative regulator of RcsB-dependent stress response